MKVQGFWQGPLGTMERMCLTSYVRMGHTFDLYMYRATTEQEDEWVSRLGGFLNICYADRIVPESVLSTFPSPSLFSDYFRYALLKAKGGWWVDMDTVCLRPFDDIEDEYVFARDNIDHFYVSGCFLRALADSPMISECLTITSNIPQAERDSLGHMDIGPKLLQRQVIAYGMEKYVAEPYTFDPIPYTRITQIVQPGYTIPLEIDMLRHQPHAIHLRQSIWNEGPNSCAGILPSGAKIMIDGEYPEDCLWNILKKRFL